MMRAAVLLGMVSVLAGAAAAAEPGPLRRAPDHVLIWSQRPGDAERAFAGLGFTVRPGQTFTDGIVNATVMFADLSYLELLHFTDPAKVQGAQARAEFAFVQQGPGANSFAIEAADLDAAAAALKGAGFDVGEVEPDMVDPDGPDGPALMKPAAWRDFHFRTSPVAGVELFFIAYPPDAPPSPEAAARFAARTTHANGARSLSAVWVQTADLEAEAAIYRRMGFTLGPAVPAPGLDAVARKATLGAGTVVLVQAAPTAAARFRRGAAPHIVGVSIATDDLSAVSRHAPGGSPTYAGLFGPSVLADTSAELGLFVEFHASRGS